MSSDTDSGFMATLIAPKSFGGNELDAFGVDASTDNEYGISGTFASLGSNDASEQGNYLLAQAVSPGGTGTYRWVFYDDGTIVGESSGHWGYTLIPEPTSVMLASLGVLGCTGGRRRS